MIRMAILGKYFSMDLLRNHGLTCPSSKRFPFGSSQQSNTVVLLHDAFQPLRFVPSFWLLDFEIDASTRHSYWNGFQTPPQWQGVAMDTHIYQMFSQDVRYTLFSCELMTLIPLIASVEDKPATHFRSVCIRVVAVLVRPLDNRRRMDPCSD